MTEPHNRFPLTASASATPGDLTPGCTHEADCRPTPAGPGKPWWPNVSVAAFSLTMFLSAALLFMVEPMFAKQVLPLLGGSAAVWTTCLVFYQVTLLAAYAYAHASASFLGIRRQVALHAGVLLAALALLPIHVPAGWTSPLHLHPVLWLLRLLLVAVGLPFFALAGSTPILQKWFAHSGHPDSSDPYFLYAASNTGSLLGLLSYPFVLEPLLRLSAQSRLWTLGYGLFVACAAFCALLVWRSPGESSLSTRDRLNVKTEATSPDKGDQITPGSRLRWVALAFVPSSVMLGVTTALTTDIPAVPLLWVLPLAIYLLSFVLVFARRPVSHRWFSRRSPLLILAAAIPLILKGALPLMVILLLDLLTLFAVAMVCHGEIARTRPATRHLTEFYLWVSVGGVLGGAFNALLAPVIFSTAKEYPIALVLAAMLCPPQNREEDDTARDRYLDYGLPLALGLAVAVAILELQSKGVSPGRYFNLLVFAPAAVFCLRFGSRPRRFGLGVAALIVASQFYAGPFGRTIHTDRSFFGVYRVSDDAEHNYRVLFHGGTAHGVQSLDPGHACEPLAYYARSGPIGQVFQAFQGTPIENNVALIGLGAGVMASYQQPNERLTFYEIDPAVLRIAQDRHYFTYLSNCAPTARVILGDARLALRDAPAHAYGMIVLDAFSGDSIPTHLLTREALALYLSKLASQGVLAFHISNRYLDLHGVLAVLARDAGLLCLGSDDAVVSADDSREGKFASWWVVMVPSATDADALAANGDWKILAPAPGAQVWTDDYSNIVSILRFR